MDVDDAKAREFRSSVMPFRRGGRPFGGDL